MQVALTYLQVMVVYVGLFLLGQGAVYIISFGKHEDNAVYRFFRFLTSPVVKVFGKLVPAKVADRHVPVVVFFMLFWIYFGLAVLIPKLGRVA